MVANRCSGDEVEIKNNGECVELGGQSVLFCVYISTDSDYFYNDHVSALTNRYQTVI